MVVAEEPIEDGRGPLKGQGAVAVQDVTQGAVQSGTCGVDVTFQHVAFACHLKDRRLSAERRPSILSYEVAFGPGDRLR